MRVVSASARAGLFASVIAFSVLAVPSARAADVPPPVISGITPATGPVAGGNVVTVNGTGLAGAYYVSVGFSDGTSFGAEIVSNVDTAIEIKLPAGPAGKADIFLQNDGGPTANTAADDYTYVAGGPGPVDPGPVDPEPQPTLLPTVSYLTPNLGISYVGGVTFLTGSRLVGVKSVKFGTTAAKFTPLSATRLLVVAPRLKRGTYPVTVETKAGVSKPASNAVYRYFGL